MLACIDAIEQWLSSNRLKMNDEKTEFIWFASWYHMKNIPQLPLRVGLSSISSSTSVRDLGVRLDNTLNLHEPVSYMEQSCFFQLRQLSKLNVCWVRQTSKHFFMHLLQAGWIIVTHCWLVNPLDFLTAYSRFKMLLLMYMLVSQVRSHVTSILWDDLHWLRVPQRISYKL